MDTNLQSPFWAITHLAAALGLEVDTAREYTYRSDFPAPKAPFSSNLWLREDVLIWFSQLPTRDRRTTKGDKGTTKTKHLPAAPPAVGRITPATPVDAPKRIKSHKPRGGAR